MPELRAQGSAHSWRALLREEVPGVRQDDDPSLVMCYVKRRRLGLGDLSGIIDG